jgi:hypothetical protein
MLINEDYDSEITFHYNDEIFSQLNWFEEPKVNISVLYKMRAQQIRDKYKHVIVSFSGGSDSYEVLWSFINNDIFIDEVQVSCFEKLTKNLDHEKLVVDRDLAYYMEYEYAVKPMLKYISEKSPETKITILDASDFFHSQIAGGKFASLDDNSNDKQITYKMSSSKLSTTVGPNHLWQYMYSVANVKQSKDKDGVCIVRGLEKPVLTIRNDNMLVFKFNDQTMMTGAAINKGYIPKAYTVEDFFWSPDMPLIPLKQSHMIKRRFETDQDYFNKYTNAMNDVIEFNKNNILNPTVSPAAIMERMFCEVIYPNWNPNIFAAPKGTLRNQELKLFETAVGKHDAETFLKELRIAKQNVFSRINKKDQFYRRISSKPYYIGRINLNHA